MIRIKLLRYALHIILAVLVCFIMSCSPQPKKQKNAIAPNVADSPEAVPLISDAPPVPESVDLEALQQPAPDIPPENAAAKPDEKAPVGQAQTASVPAHLVLIPGSKFQMGNNDGDSDESPAHAVTVDSFYMGKYEVSQKEYIAVMGSNPSGFKGNSLPVESVSWHDAVEYCNRLSAKEGLQPAYSGEGDGLTCNFSASGYRLPTEAEWEYAAGRGKTAMYSGSNDANAVAWFNINSDGITHDIGTKAANGMGLYDMSGNVAEWCWDWYREYTAESAFVGKTRVVRGGGWGNSEWNLRISARSHNSPTMRNSSVGFRIARGYGR